MVYIHDEREKGLLLIPHSRLTASSSNAPLEKQSTALQQESSSIADEQETSTPSGRNYAHALAGDPRVHSVLRGSLQAVDSVKSSLEDAKNLKDTKPVKMVTSAGTAAGGWLKEVSSRWFPDATQATQDLASRSKTSYETYQESLKPFSEALSDAWEGGIKALREGPCTADAIGYAAGVSQAASVLAYGKYPRGM